MLSATSAYTSLPPTFGVSLDSTMPWLARDTVSPVLPALDDFVSDPQPDPSRPSATAMAMSAASVRERRTMSASPGNPSGRDPDATGPVVQGPLSTSAGPIGGTPAENDPFDLGACRMGRGDHIALWMSLLLNAV